MQPSEWLDARHLNLLACPRDHQELHADDGHLACAKGHRYPIVDGIPILLLAEKEQTIGVATASLQAAISRFGHPLYLDTLGISEDEKRGIERDWAEGRNSIDPAISHLVGATSGFGYVELIGRLNSYPIPDIPVAAGAGERLLDIGCNWGRWSVSAARKGWSAIGIDPSLGAVLAAQRAVSSQGLDVSFVCGDARFLPFRANTFGCVFSYSVIQHLSEKDAETAVSEMGRVLRTGGLSKIQMAHEGGLRSTYSRTRKHYLNSGLFRVRYWSLAAMRDVFERAVGPVNIAAEAFGGLGLLAEDRRHVSAKAKALITISTLLKKLALFVPPLIRLADSVYVAATKRKAQ
jgi:SAM-dependent methyltransferase/uncharacterized protein YbaR (Trm112 family)